MNAENVVDFNCDGSFMDFAKQMLVRTANDGSLYLRNWYDVFSDELDDYNDYKAVIKWDRRCFSDVFARFFRVSAVLYELSDYLDEMDGMGEIDEIYETAESILQNEELVDAYMLFVNPSQEDCLEWLSEINGVAGNELCGRYYIAHARRLCRLWQLGAPKHIVQKESRYLFAAISTYHYAKSFEQIKKQ